MCGKSGNFEGINFLQLLKNYFISARIRDKVT